MRGAARRLRKEDEELYESLLEAKLVVTSGHLPDPGGLNQQAPQLRATLSWLNRAGVLDWLHRSQPM